MLHHTLFVFDIETIPDTEAAANLLGHEAVDGKSTVELREALEQYHLDITGGKNSFLRQPFHKVVAISFLEAEISRDGGVESYTLKDLRSGGTEKSSEEELVKGFFQYFSRNTPRLVSFNGRTFDLPVLQYRAMKYGVAAPKLHQSGDKWNSYTSRYSLDWHCDLIEALSSFGASARVRLNEVCSIMGYPGKFGVDGSKVATMHDDGKVAEIRDYCETDVLNTYLVYLRWMHHTGILTKGVYNQAVGEILSYIDAEKEARPYLAEFFGAWDEACGGQFVLKP